MQTRSAISPTELPGCSKAAFKHESLFSFAKTLQVRHSGGFKLSISHLAKCDIFTRSQENSQRGHELQSFAFISRSFTSGVLPPARAALHANTVGEACSYGSAAW